MSNFKLYDIEVFPNYFQIGIKDYVTKDIVSFEVSFISIFSIDE